MADNVTIPGAGETIAADDIGGGVKVQRVKVQFGADGSATDASSGNPLPTAPTAALSSPVAVRLSNGTDALDVTSRELHVRDAAARTALAAIQAAVETLDNIVSGAGVNQTQVAGTAIAVNAGNVSAGTQRVVLATDQPAVAVSGTLAHDAADSGNPIKIGGRARTALPTAVAQDDRTDAMTDKFGRQLAIGAPLDQRRSGTVNFTGNTASDVIAAPGASTALVVTRILVVNGHATVGTKVSVRDGTTAKAVGYAAALGGGWTIEDPNGLFVAATNTAVTAICGTTGADVDVTVFGYTIPA